MRTYSLPLFANLFAPSQGHHWSVLLPYGPKHRTLPDGLPLLAACNRALEPVDVVSLGLIFRGLE